MKHSYRSLIVLFTLSFCLQYCCTNQMNREKIKENEQRNNFKKLFPRGMIEANIIPNKIWEKDDKYFCKAMIDRVINTGGGIRPIAESTEYALEIDRTIYKNFEQNIGSMVKSRIVEIPVSMNENLMSRKYKVISVSKN